MEQGFLGAGVEVVSGSRSESGSGSSNEE